MKKGRMSYLLCLLTVVFLLGIGGRRVFAESENGSLTIRRAASDSVFYLYRIGTMDEQGELSVDADFSKYAIDWNLEDEASMRRAADTLAYYIAQDKPKAYAEAEADSSGIVVFSDLKPALYLAIGDTVIRDGVGYIQNPIMTYVPFRDYDGSVILKVEAVVKATTFEDETSYSVYKVWKGEKDHPDSIDVNLLQDENVIDTVVLDEDNNWQYKWKELETGHRYMVTEATVPKGYTVDISQNKGVFTITNHSTITPPPSVTPPGNPPGSPPGSTPKIPQTGQLWWPVSILAAAGLFCLLIGALSRRNSGKNNGIR